MTSALRRLAIKPTESWFAAIIFWGVLVLISLFLGLSTLQNNYTELLHQQAKAFFKQIITTRLWNAQHGGVYVLVTERNPPNPYLEDPLRDLSTTSGQKLTKINPAYMTRQLAEIAKKSDDVNYHITSLNPIRPENRASDWETAALQTFEQGQTEWTQFVRNDSEQTFRYMAPLFVDKPCLKCHAKQGYQEGQVRGGISVSIPLAPTLAELSQTRKPYFITHAMVFLLGSVGILYFRNFARHSRKRLDSYAFQLEQRNQELEDFAFIASHDMRTPLVNIKGFASELAESLHGADSLLDKFTMNLSAKERCRLMQIFKEEVPESLLHIESAACQMERMIKALLDLNYMGQKQLSPQQLDMTMLAKAVVESFGNRVQRGKVQIHLDPLPVLFTDRAAMEEILISLVDNALKYLLPERPGEIRLSAEVDKEKATFQLRDNGRGIAGEDMPKIFKIFRRLGQQNVDGEGVGLVRARTLVHRLGGEMWCESQLGVGTKVYFTIPARRNGEL